MNQQSITRESLNNLLRSFSHKRRNGVLCLEFERRHLELAFREGKIVGVEELRSDVALELCRRLVEAGCISEKVLEVIAGREISISQLGELLVDKGYVSQDEFVRAKQALELDLLHSLAELESGTADFRPQLIRNDPKTSISVFPGQLMLDLEEFNADRARMLQLFDPAQALLLKEDPPAVLTAGERMLLAAAGSGGNVEAILSRCLLSQYEAIESLLSLYDQEVIGISARPGAFGETDGEAESFRLSATEQAATALQEIDEEDLGESEPEFLAERGVLVESPAELESVSARSAESESAVAEGDLESREEDEDISAAATLKTSSRTGLKGVIKAGSYHLLHPEVVRFVIFFAATGLLLALGLIGPRMFEEWFNALANFSSRS